MDTKTQARLRVCNKALKKLVGTVHPDRQLVIFNEIMLLDQDFTFFEVGLTANTASFLITCEQVRRRFPLITVLVSGCIYEAAINIINVCGGRFGAVSTGSEMLRDSAYLDWEALQPRGHRAVYKPYIYFDQSTLNEVSVELRNGCRLRVCSAAHIAVERVPANQSITRCNANPDFYPDPNNGEMTQEYQWTFTPAACRDVAPGEDSVQSVELPWFWNGDNNKTGNWVYCERDAFLFDERSEITEPAVLYGSSWVGISDAKTSHERLSPS